MAFSYSPKIVTNGLVLYLDAANPYSYVSGSTVWNDISREGNNVTLVNGPGYSSANGGSIIFDGVNDYGVLPYHKSMDNTNTTLSVWIKTTFVIGPNTRHYVFDGLGHKTMLFVDESYELNFVISLGTFQEVNYNAPVIASNTWVNLVGTYNGSEMNLYINGTLVNSLSVSGNIDSTTNPGRIMDYIGDGYETEGLATNFMMYNRGLTASEVLQNYNATKGRFGLK